MTVSSKLRQDSKVHHPSHYTQGKVECIDAIESALGLEGFIAFLRGQIIKYTWRLNDKENPLQDAEKAQWYGDKLTTALAQRQKAVEKANRKAIQGAALTESKKETSNEHSNSTGGTATTASPYSLSESRN
jgi:hypothetical protein